MSAIGAQTRPAGRVSTRAAARAAEVFVPALLAIVAAGVVVRVLYTLLAAPWPPPGLDDQFYFSAQAKLIADGHGFAAPFQYAFHHQLIPTAEHPPLYPLVLAGLAKLGGTTPDAQRLAGSVFGAGTIAVVGLIGRRVGGALVGLIAALLAAVYPMLIAADGALMSESLFGLLVALSLLCALRLLEAPTARRAALFGVVAALAALTRGEGLLLVPLLLLPLLRSAPGRRAALVAVAAAVVTLAPWTIRNWIVFHQPVVIATDSGSAIGGANCRPTYYGHELGGWWPACLHPSPGNEAQHMAHLRHVGVSYAGHHLGRLPVVLAARLGRVWALYDPMQLPEGRAAGAQKTGVLAFFVLVLLAVLGARRLRRGPARWVLAVPFIVVCVTALTTYGNQRFREPAELSLVLLAAVALDGLRRAGRRRARTRAPAAG